MAEQEVYIKGYKVDRDKVNATYGSREDDLESTRFLAIWEKFPSISSILGVEESRMGKLLVLVDWSLKTDTIRRVSKRQLYRLLRLHTRKVFTAGIRI